MARVSKKVSAAQREAENAQHRIWKTAIYARLSDFDAEKRNVSRRIPPVWIPAGPERLP